MGNLREHLQSQKTLGDYIASLSDASFDELRVQILGSYDAVVKYKNQMKEYR